MLCIKRNISHKKLAGNNIIDDPTAVDSRNVTLSFPTFLFEVLHIYPKNHLSA